MCPKSRWEAQTNSFEMCTTEKLLIFTLKPRSLSESIIKLDRMDLITDNTLWVEQRQRIEDSTNVVFLAMSNRTSPNKRWQRENVFLQKMLCWLAAILKSRAILRVIYSQQQWICMLLPPGPKYGTPDKATCQCLVLGQVAINKATGCNGRDIEE